MQRFFDSGFLELGEKLGPILWQFAPNQQFDAADFAAFLALLPAELGGRAIRHVVEVRHPSFRTPEFIDLLREHSVAVAMVDDAKHPAFDELTADFAYLRLRRCAETSRPAIRPTRSTAGPSGCDGWSSGPRLFPLLHQRRQSPRPRRRPGADRAAW